LKKVEKESLIKSFLLFFLSQSLLIGALFFLNFQKEVQTLDEQIFAQMRICSFDLQCKEYKIDFVPKDEHELYKLYKTPKELSSYFTIPNSRRNYLKIYLEKNSYNVKVNTIKRTLFLQFLILELIVALLSLLFALYALSPLRNALRLTEEFIKDILHDFNTPLSTLRLNISMLKTKIGENSQIKRIENSIQNILNLQNNLRSYLHSHASQKEEFALKPFLKERVELISANHKDISFHIEDMNATLFTNRDAFSRIIDNLLSNAAKYNKKNGSVTLRLEKSTLLIEDTGKGIKNPKRVFERFYKEQDRGIGIGLHIVQKLCDELGIKISLQSQLSHGTTFKLKLINIIKND
jgi:signal transduction histidine kinase